MCFYEDQQSIKNDAGSNTPTFQMRVQSLDVPALPKMTEVLLFYPSFNGSDQSSNSMVVLDPKFSLGFRLLLMKTIKFHLQSHLKSKLTLASIEMDCTLVNLSVPPSDSFH